MSEQTEGSDPVVQRARDLFERSVDGLDGATRSRLTGARHAALVAASSRRSAWMRGFAPAGAVAAAAVLGIALWLGAGRTPVAPQPRGGAIPDALEFVAQAEDVELLDDDPEFYAWAVDSVADGIG